MIRNAKDLADYFGCEPTESSMSKGIYKGTSCGAWLSLEEDGIKIGSIVEGVDEYAETQCLPFPFSTAKLMEAIQAVENDADRIWNETHGCDDCGMEDEFGRRHVNPNCKTCKGEGTVI